MAAMPNASPERCRTASGERYIGWRRGNTGVSSVTKPPLGTLHRAFCLSLSLAPLAPHSLARSLARSGRRPTHFLWASRTFFWTLYFMPSAIRLDLLCLLLEGFIADARGSMSCLSLAWY